MDIWYMTLNCAMNLSILVSILIVVVLGYCLWKANEQTTQKNLPDYQRVGTCDKYGFQADVVEVKEDRLLINNVSMLLMNHISYGFSFGTGTYLVSIQLSDYGYQKSGGVDFKLKTAGREQPGCKKRR